MCHDLSLLPPQAEQMMPFRRLPCTVSTALPGVTAAFSLLYGIRYAHNIYPLVNALNLWLAANNSSAIVGTVHDCVIGKRRLSILPGVTDIESPIRRSSAARARSISPNPTGSPTKRTLS